MKHLSTFFLTLLFIFSGVTIVAQEQMNKQSNIQNQTIHSAILQRDLALQIYLPEDYSQTSRDYPVLYILDGHYYFYYGVAFQQTAEWRYKSPRFIVVGIRSDDKQLRRLDFGSAQRFLKYRDFLEKELLPYIENNYRASDDRMIFGWQSAGYSVIEILLKRPDLFNAYFAASAATADSVAFSEFANRGLPAEKFLYFATSPDETWLSKSVAGFTELLEKKAPAQLRWKKESLPEEDHWSTPYRTIYRGVTEYYRDFKPISFESLQAFEGAGGIEQLTQHYQNRSEKYNTAAEIHHATIFNLLSLSMRADDFDSFDFFMNYFKGRIAGLYPVRWHHRYGQFYLKHGKLEKARSFFETGIQRLPDAPLLYAGLGDTFEKMGDTPKALAAYEKATALAAKNEDPQLERFQARLKALGAGQ